MLFVAGFTSCSDWLEVDPMSEVKADELLKNEKGFRDLLNGCYLQMGAPALYGRELTYGIVDVLGQTWNISAGNNPNAEKIRKYNYNRLDNASGMNAIDLFWTGLYNTIVNVDYLLEQIEGKQNLFVPLDYELIKGEALGLRAYLHFDLLRLYGRSFKSGPDKQSIPYVTQMGVTITPQSTVREVLGLVLKDLDAAMEILKDVDPICTGQTPSPTTDHWFQDRRYRKIRMNYDACLALKARVYLYMENYTEAFKAAESVVNTGRYSWVTSIEATSEEGNRDRLYWNELIFCLDVYNFANWTSVLAYVSAKPLAGYFQSAATQTVVFELGKEECKTDWRYVNLTEASGNIRYCSKYRQPGIDEASGETIRKNKLPMLRMSEMYYIMAECVKDSDPKAAIGYLNQVREHRGIKQDLPEDLTSEQIQEEIYKEYRKEFIAEGQIFFYYKRLNYSAIPGSNEAINDDVYCLPVPLLEEEIGERVDLN